MAPPVILSQGVSLRWLEKVWLCVDFGQLYALLWVAAQPWPWPYLWINWTSWTVWMNLDYFSLTKDGALYGQTGNVGISRWGQMDDYLYYALAFSVLPLLMAFPLLFYKAMTPRQLSFAKMAVLMLWQLLYLPCGLGVFRLYYCEDNDELSADPSESCTSKRYKMYTAMSTVLVAPLIVGLPMYMYRLTYDLVVYNFRHDHEKRLQAWELMYGLALDSYWLESQAWIMSSFKRNGVYFRTQMLAMKLTLLLIFIFVRENLLTQAGLYLIATIVFCLPVLRYRPFRLPSTNVIAAVLIFTLLCATTSAMMNAAGVENAAMVASRQSFFLWALFSFGVMLIGACMLWSYLLLRDDWPPLLTVGRINDSNMRGLVVKWIGAMAEANFIVSDCLDSVAEIRDLTEFNRVVSTVRSCWLNARSNGSLFEVMLGDVLDKLLIFHKVFFVPNSIRRTREYLHTALLEAGDSLLRREKSTILMSRRKRSMLTKMTALKAFLGGRVLDDSFNLLQQHSNIDVESAASLHIYDPELSNSGNDWGAERDRLKDILEGLEATVRLTETVLQLEDPSVRMQDLLSLGEFWTEVVGLLDSRRLVEADLPPLVKTEDCYTYRRLVEDCVAQFDLGQQDEGDGDADSDVQMWNNGNVGHDNDNASTDYGSLVEAHDDRVDLGSLIGSIEEGNSEYGSYAERVGSDVGSRINEDAISSTEQITRRDPFRDVLVRRQPVPRVLSPRDETPETLTQRDPLVRRDPLPQESTASDTAPMVAQRLTRRNPSMGRAPPPRSNHSWEPDLEAVPSGSASEKINSEMAAATPSGSPTKTSLSPLAYNLEQGTMVERRRGDEDDIEIEADDDDSSLALSIETAPRPPNIDTTAVAQQTPVELDESMVNPYELTPRRQDSEDSIMNMSVVSE